MVDVSRKPHWILPLRSKSQPQEWVFFDVETNPIEDETGIQHHMIMGWAFYWRRNKGKRPDIEEWMYFENPTDFWDWLEKKSRPDTTIHLIAHNIHFDFSVVNGFKELHERGWAVKNPLIKGKKVIVSVTKGGRWTQRVKIKDGVRQVVRTRKGVRRLRILDSLNHFPVSLKRLGDSVGLPKLDVDPLNADTATLRGYCKRDVEILIAAYRKWLAFLDTNGFGRFAYTLSGQAMNTWRSAYLSQPLYAHSDKDGIGLEFDAYHGGRTEAFFLGDWKGENITVCDVNSLYPFCMKKDLPYALAYELSNPSVERLHTAMRFRTAIAEVEVRPTIPALPLRYDKRLVFPLGHFRTTLPGPELREALQRGWVLKVHRALIYETGPVFGEYVDKLYELRQEYKASGDVAFDTFVKLLLNSLYGKFGQKNPVWKTMGTSEEYKLFCGTYINAETKERFLERQIGDLCQVKQGEEVAHNSIPVIAATITSYARLRMLSLLERAGWGNVLYTDTDSLFLTPDGLSRIQADIDPTKLGHLKVERESPHLTIHGLKDYVFDGEKTIKGISKSAVWDNDNTATFFQWPSIGGLMWRGEQTGYRQIKVTKTLQRIYKKGFKSEGGWVVPPYFPSPGSVPVLPPPHCLDWFGVAS